MSLSSSVSDDEVIRLRNENEELRESLRKLEMSNQEVQEESRFNSIKAMELNEILTVRDPSIMQQKLIDKSLKVAELRVVVDNLQSQVDATKEANRKLEMEKEASKTIFQPSSEEYESTIIQLKQQMASLKDERAALSSKCSSLEKSLEVMKKKCTDRAVRSSKALKRMQHQVTMLEAERDRLSRKSSTLDEATIVVDVREEKQSISGFLMTAGLI